MRFSLYSQSQTAWCCSMSCSFLCKQTNLPNQSLIFLFSVCEFDKEQSWTAFILLFVAAELFIGKSDSITFFEAHNKIRCRNFWGSERSVILIEKVGKTWKNCCYLLIKYADSMFEMAVSQLSLLALLLLSFKMWKGEHIFYSWINFISFIA